MTGCTNNLRVCYVHAGTVRTNKLVLQECNSGSTSTLMLHPDTKKLVVQGSDGSIEDIGQQGPPGAGFTNDADGSYIVNEKVKFKSDVEVLGGIQTNKVNIRSSEDSTPYVLECASNNVFTITFNGKILVTLVDDDSA